MQKLIIVCGFAGSGKTTLAKELSRKLNIICLHKDTIKENLYEILGLSTLEDSRRIGNQSVQLLLKIAEEQLANGVDLIIEAPFNFSDDYSLFASWIEKYKIELYSIVCKIDEDVMIKRRNDRLSERHHAHHDQKRLEIGSYGKADYAVYETMSGKKIDIVTNKPVEELVGNVLREIS